MARGDTVIGFDNLNSYYDPHLKEARLAVLHREATSAAGTFRMHRANLADRSSLTSCFSDHAFDRVIHLAAQAGVRHSIDQPEEYIESNLLGFGNLLEACRRFEVTHLTFASTSSVYGANSRQPYAEHHGADHPIQLYAATKRANELMAHAYSSLYKLPTTGLRFFTVYGPWGRPDMAYYKFTKAIFAGEPIHIYNYGIHTRDFTFIDDIVKGTIAASDHVAKANPNWDSMNPDPSSSYAPFRIFNIGAGQPVLLTDFIAAIEANVGKSAIRESLPFQAGDVPSTYADTTKLVEAVGYQPKTSFQDGIKAFVDWYREYHGL